VVSSFSSFEFVSAVTGSFISFFGLVDLVVSIFNTQFMLLGILYFGLLYLAGKTIGKSWIAGIFSIILFEMK
jgi:hypothetical protein